MAFGLETLDETGKLTFSSGRLGEVMVLDTFVTYANSGSRSYGRPVHAFINISQDSQANAVTLTVSGQTVSWLRERFSYNPTPLFGAVGTITVVNAT